MLGHLRVTPLVLSSRMLAGVAFELGEKLLEIDLLVVDDIGFVGCEIGIADKRRGLHAAQGGEQFGILVLRLVEQDIEPDRLGLHLVDDLQRARQHPAIERRAFARGDQRLVVIDHHRDAIVLLDLVRQDRAAPVIQRAFGIARARRGDIDILGAFDAPFVGHHLVRDVPAVARDQQRHEHQHRGQYETTRAGLAHIAPAADQQIVVSVLAQPPPPRGPSNDPFLLYYPAVLEQ